MTMQIGILASDGIILASDTLANRSPLPNMNVRLIRQTFGTSKIRVSADKKIAVTCARDMLQAYDLADAIIAGLPQELWATPDQRMLEIAWSELYKHQEWRGVECLVAFAEPQPALFLLQCVKTPQDAHDSVCHPVINYAFAGDSSNPSTYWAMRYLDSLSPEMNRVDALVPLAAQIVVEARHFSSATVSGLEIIVCDGAGVRRLTKQENQKQLEAAVQRRKRIKDIFSLPTRSRILRHRCGEWPRKVRWEKR